MIEIGEKIALIFPNIFFVIINLLSISKEIEFILKMRKHNIVTDTNITIFLNASASGIFFSVFIESFLLSLINGLSIILVLKQTEMGIVLMILNSVISVLGLTYRNIEPELLMGNSTRCQTFFSICRANAFGHIGYIWFYGATFLDILKQNITPYLMGLAFFIIGIWVHKKILPKTLPGSHQYWV